MSLLDRLIDGVLGKRKPSQPHVRKIRAVTNNFKGDIDKTMTDINENIDAVKEQLEESIEKRSDIDFTELQNKIDEEIEALRGEVNESFASLEEKIHSENVKTYRNMQALVTELEKKVAKESTVESMLKGQRKIMGVATWMIVGILIILALFVLHSLGVF